MTTAAEATPSEAPSWREESTTIGHEVGVPVAVAIAVLTAAGIAVGYLITGDFGAAVDRLDLRIARELVASRTPTWNRITAASTVLGDSVTVAILWVAAMALAAWRTRSWRIPIFLLAAIGGEKLTYLFTSLAVGRPRPTVPSLGHVYATNSFPSGHVGSAIVLYGGLVVALLWHGSRTRDGSRPLLVRLLAAAMAAAITVTVGFSRMYRGHHYASDIAWGVLLGVAWLVLAWRVVLRPAPPAPASP